MTLETLTAIAAVNPSPRTRWLVSVCIGWVESFFRGTLLPLSSTVRRTRRLCVLKKSEPSNSSFYAEPQEEISNYLVTATEADTELRWISNQLTYKTEEY
jgi:hypothetical protein